MPLVAMSYRALVLEEKVSYTTATPVTTVSMDRMTGRVNTRFNQQHSIMQTKGMTSNLATCAGTSMRFPLTQFCGLATGSLYQPQRRISPHLSFRSVQGCLAHEPAPRLPTPAVKGRLQSLTAQHHASRSVMPAMGRYLVKANLVDHERQGQRHYGHVGRRCK